MSPAFDPYYKWFGIRPEEQPPDLYRLLGIEKFESDADVISNAADQRMNHLRTLQNGPQAAHSQRILNEVSRARVTLLDVERKLAYDVELRKRIAAQAAASRATSVASAYADRAAEGDAIDDEFSDEIAADAQATAAFGDTDDDPLSSIGGAGAIAAVGAAVRTTASRDVRRRPKKSAGSMFLSSILGGITGLAVTLLILAKFSSFDPFGIFADKAGGNGVATNQAGAGDKRPEDGVDANGKSGKNSQSNENGVNSASDKQTNGPSNGGSKNASGAGDKSHSGNGANGRDAPVKPRGKEDRPAQRPLNVFDKFPAYVELPSPGISSPQTLAEFAGATPVALAEIGLIADAANASAGMTFRMAVEQKPGAASRWRIGLSPASTGGGLVTTLADIWLEGTTLKFQWQTPAATNVDASQVRNCVLRVRADGKTAHLALRAPQMRPAYTVNLSRQVDSEEIKLEDPPKIESLALEVGPLADFPGEAKFKYDRQRAKFRAETKEEVVVSLAQINIADKPELHWQPMSLKTGLQLKVTPVLENAKGTFALTRSNVDEIRKNHTVRKAKVDKQWNDLRERSLTLQKQFKDVEKRLVTTPAQINARQKELVRLSNQIAVVKKEFDKVDADKQTVDAVLAAVPAVDELVGRLHNVARIPYRVVAKAGPVEIELIRATE